MALTIPLLEDDDLGISFERKIDVSLFISPGKRYKNRLVISN